MASILFANSYFYRFDSKQWKAKQPYPPLGTIYAAAFMRQNGYDVALYDTNLLHDIQGFKPRLESMRPDYLVIYDDGFNYLTKMCLTTMRDAAFEMIKLGKEFGIQVIVCSSDSTDHYQQYLEQGADYIIHGEGELTLLELVTNLEHSTSTDAVLGISYRDASGINKNSTRPVLRDLDVLPDPAWDLIDIDAYRTIWMQHQGYFSLNIATTRGCPYKCNWCAKPIYGNRYNSRSPQRVVDEIDMLVNTFDVQYFWMCDDIFGLKPGWVQAFDAAIKEKNLQIKYKIQSRVDLLLKEDNIDVLASSGLDMAWLGAESGSQKILDAMDKGTKVEQIYQATEILQSKGIKVAFFLQFGYLGETMRDIKKTMKMVLDIMPDEIGISVSYPLPGTKFYDIVKEDLKSKANWTDSDDLDMMFQNTYNKAFYRTLHRYMHNQYKMKRGWQGMLRMIKNPLGLSRHQVKDFLSIGWHLPNSMINRMRLRAHARQSS